MIKTAEQIEQIVLRQAGRGLLAGGTFLNGRMKEMASVPAPWKWVTAGPRSTSRVPGTRYKVATTRATPGAPPRKITGDFRRKIMVRQPQPHVVQIGVFNDVRARPFETWMNHSVIRAAFFKYRNEMQRIIGSEFGSRMA